MALYDRIIGKDDLGQTVENRINPQVLAVVLSEFFRDRLTGAGARGVLESLGSDFDTDEKQEIMALFATLTAQPNPTAKLARRIEIEDVLFLARLQAPGYSRPAEIKARLGV